MKKNILLIASLFIGNWAFAQKADKPNILFIFTDDLTINGLGSTSNHEVKTPNLDRLKEQGTFFSHTFNQGGFNAAISVASRAMLNTGMYLWKACDETGGYTGTSKDVPEWPNGVEPYKAQKPAQRSLLWSEHMRNEGYETYITGKWHVPTPAQEVFDHANHIRPGMPNQTKEGYARKFIEGVPDKWTPVDTTYGGYWKGGKHWSEVVRDDALQYIAHAKESDKPFFMYIAFNAPHDPRQAPQEYQDLYNVSDIKVPETFMPIYPYCEEAGTGRGLRDEWLAPFPRTEYSVKVNRKEYYALISHLDTQIGMILDALEKSGKLDNTYIFFTADHGLAVGDHGLLGKQNQYEASVRVPMIAAGPSIKKGQEINNMVYLQDVMATVLDIAGSKAVNQVDFQSFLPLAQGKKMKTRKAIISCYSGCQRMIRTDKYKMIIYPSANLVRLFDIQKDPLEMNDLANDRKNKDLMDKLFVEFQSLQKEIKDPLNVVPYYNKFMERF